MSAPLSVAWITYFPIEWLDDLPPELASLAKMHPATWQRVLLTELQKEANLRLHIIILRKQFSRTQTFERGNATFHCIRIPGGWRAPSFFWTDTRCVARVLKSVKPDLVHAWGTENAAGLVASRLGYPWILTMQGIMNWMIELGLANLYQRFAARLETTTLHRAEHVTAESNFAVDYLAKHYPGLKPKQIEHAPHSSFHEVSRQPRLDPRRIICIGTLSAAKGTDVLLQSLDSLCETHPFELILVGGASAEAIQQYQASVSPQLWSRIQFKNHLTSAQIAEELSSATLMVYPTRADNSPNAVKEAVVAGVPVVASGIGGIVDYVHPGKNGFLFPAGDINGCREAILAALQHESLGKGQVPPETLAQVRDYLSPATMSRKFLEAYRSAIS